MVLLIFAGIGLYLGYRMGITRQGYVTMATVSVSATLLEIIHLMTTSDRSAMTLLPIVIGAILVAFMLLGTFVPRTGAGAQAS